MLALRPADARGHAEHGWLDSRHTFSFASYFDPRHMGFGPLRVINEDRIKGGTGFGAHPHRDMEIISYVISGALEHEDSMGNKAVIRPGEVQRMSAGTGVVHSEKNHLADEETHFLQIWIQPKTMGIKPGYGQKDFSEALAREPSVLVVSPDGRDGSIAINQDAEIHISRLKAHDTLRFALRSGRRAWVQMVKGSVVLQGAELKAGDGIAVTDVTTLELVGKADADLLLFDLPVS